MRRLHILHGGIENGDRDWLVRSARLNLKSKSWIAPKSVQIGDSAVIFVGSSFFATARIASQSHKRPNWGRNRYGAAIESVKLISPPISRPLIRKRIPNLVWAKYPRSITTPAEPIAERIRNLIAQRRKRGGSDVDDKVLQIASLQELRARAQEEAKNKIKKKVRMTTHRVRSRAVHAYVLGRANGLCEGCGSPAPFMTPRNTPYLEPHHTTRLADDGPDAPSDVIALCPTCHSRVHRGVDGERYNARLLKKVRKKEASCG